MQDQNITSAPSMRLIRLPEVQRLTGLGRSTIYNLIGEGRFPRQRRVTPTIAVWSETEVQRWAAGVLNQEAATAAALAFDKRQPSGNQFEEGKKKKGLHCCKPLN